MVLVSFGKLKEQLGFDKTQRRFSFAQLAGSTELQRLANEAQALKRAEKPLDRVQQEALGVSDRLTLFARVMDGSALLIVPASTNETDPWVEPRVGRNFIRKHNSRRSKHNCRQLPLRMSMATDLTLAAQRISFATICAA